MIYAYYGYHSIITLHIVSNLTVTNVINQLTIIDAYYANLLPKHVSYRDVSYVSIFIF